MHATAPSVRRAFLLASSALALACNAASQAGTAESPPPGVDLNPAFAHAGLVQRHQGARPTCSVFAVAGALEFALAEVGEGAPALSVEFLDWASNQATGEAQDGSYFSDLWRGFELYGVCDEPQLPYRDAFDPTLQPSPEVLELAARRRGLGLGLRWIKEWDVTTGLTPEQLAEIRHVIAGGHPVAGGMRWPRQASWTDGVLDMAPPEGVFDGHSVLLVGYQDDPGLPGGGAFLTRDSGAGARGTRIPYAYVAAYLNDAIWIDGPRRVAGAGASATDGELDLTLLSPLVPPPAGRNRRSSSNAEPWHDANIDMDWLMPGDSVEVPLLEGPGLITHIWMTSHSGWVNELDSLVLRIWWDGREAPGVEVPLGDFFAVGQGKPASVESVPVQVSPTGSLSCMWRMPFRESARITITNDNPDRSTGLYWQVDWMQLDEVSARTPYFHARFRSENPAVLGRDYNIADLSGRGLYVGSVQSVTTVQDDWFGEGDDFFYVDGEQVPSLQGTGTEDYFNDAWGYRVRTGPWFGQPRWEGYTTGASLVSYRWHLCDPVFFTRSLRVDIEHKGNRPDSTDGFYLERPDYMSSVAYWYQLGEPKACAPLAPWHERRVPWEQHHLLRAFRQARVSGDVGVQVSTEGAFGARPILVWPNATPAARLELPFTLEHDGRYAVRLTAAEGPARGVYAVLLDGETVREADFHAVEDGERVLSLGTHELAAGAHTLTFRASADLVHLGALGVELLELLALPPEARREQRTANEAHFVRLAIGRAVYAYRLALDELPDSLQTLVDKGFLPERYLSDENELPLKCWVEDGSLWVESPGSDRWRHSWKGLDARR